MLQGMGGWLSEILKTDPSSAVWNGARLPALGKSSQEPCAFRLEQFREYGLPVDSDFITR